jgi:two-component system LytT family sensor kinase
MDLFQKISLENRYLRHGLFWIVWVIGFTFVKSFGASLDVYFGWLIYYIVTLPLFIIHTYLIVYWAAKKFLKGPRIIFFIVLFILLMSVFSFIELIVTDELLSRFIPEIFSNNNYYLDL